MAVFLSPLGAAPQFFDNQGLVLSGGLLYFFAAGSSTPQNTYADSSGSTANENPIELDSAGRPPDDIYFSEGVDYKLIIKDADENTLLTVDNLVGLNDAVETSPDEWIASGLTPTYISSTSFSLAGDQSTEFHVGRKVKLADGGGTKYCRITVAAFTTLTTLTVEGDSLATPTSAVSLGILRRTNTSLPALEDDELIVVDPADQTKRARLDVVSVTAGQTRVVTVPDKNGTMAMLSDFISATRQVFTSGSGTYTTPSGATYIKIRMIGGGGGGGGNGSAASPTSGSNGGDTTFSTFTASGGTGGNAGASGSAGSGAAGGGTSGTPDIGISGGSGGGGYFGALAGTVGGPGGNGFFGGGGQSPNTGTGGAGATNSGAGGSGAPGNASAFLGGGGGAGGYVEHLITSPSATYAYAVGAGGAGGDAGTNGAAGGAGGSGIIIVDEFYD